MILPCSDSDSRWPPPITELRLLEANPHHIDTRVFIDVLNISVKLHKSMPLKEEEKMYIYNRYFMGITPIKGSKPLPNKLIVSYLSYMVRNYEWDECYEVNNLITEDKLERDLEEYLKTINLKNDTIEQEYKDVMYFYVRYNARKEHVARLKYISKCTGIRTLRVQEMDMMIHIRKMAFMNPKMSIRTKQSVDYLYFFFYDDCDKDYEGQFVKVGHSCPVCLKGTKLRACTRCMETHYCSRKHQVEHWPTHKHDCIVSR